MRNKIGLALSLYGIFSGCASNGVRNYQKDEILATAGNKPMPAWAETGEIEPFKIKEGKLYSVGNVYIRGDEIPSSGARLSSNIARSQISKAVENKMEFIFQAGIENFSYDSQVAKYIGSEVSSITTSQMRDEGTWWKRVAQSDEDGSRKIRYVIYSLVTMPEKEFQSAVFKAANKAVAERKVSPDFQKQLANQWDRFVEGKSTAPSANNGEASSDVRRPAAVDPVSKEK